MKKKLIILLGALMLSIVVSVVLHYQDHKSVLSMVAMFVSNILLIVVCVVALLRNRKK